MREFSLTLVTFFIIVGMTFALFHIMLGPNGVTALLSNSTYNDYGEPVEVGSPSICAEHFDCIKYCMENKPENTLAQRLCLQECDKLK